MKTSAELALLSKVADKAWVERKHGPIPITIEKARAGRELDVGVRLRKKYRALAVNGNRDEIRASLKQDYLIDTLGDVDGQAILETPDDNNLAASMAAQFLELDLKDTLVVSFADLPTADVAAPKPRRAFTEQGKPIRERYFRWQRELAVLEYPSDAGERQRLADAGVKGPATFYKIGRFCAFIAAAYGSYGMKIKASEETMGSDFHGTSRTTVGRWLDIAVALGIFTRARKAVRHGPNRRPAEYRINEFWRRK